jgi:hypothetical protein
MIFLPQIQCKDIVPFVKFQLHRNVKLNYLLFALIDIHKFLLDLNYLKNNTNTKNEIQYSRKLTKQKNQGG